MRYAPNAGTFAAMRCFRWAVCLGAACLGQVALGCGGSGGSTGSAGSGGAQSEGGSIGVGSQGGSSNSKAGSGGNAFTNAGAGSHSGGTSFGGGPGSGGESAGGSKAGDGGSAGVGGSAGAGGETPVEEYPEPLAASSRYFESGLNPMISELMLPVSQPETGASSPLWLMSSSLERYQELDASARSLTWTGEIKNFSDQQVCEAFLKVAFMQQGNKAFELAARVEGEQRVVQGLRVICIQPKAVAPAYFYQILDQELMTAKLDGVEVTWMTGGDAANEAPPNPLAPSTELQQIVGQPGAWKVKLELKGAAGGAIKNLSYYAYPRLGDFLGPRVSGFKDELKPGETWQFLSLTTFKGVPGATQQIRSSLRFEQPL